MSVFRRFALLLLVSLLPCGTALAAESPTEYRYISAQDLEAHLKADLPTNIVDIQVEEEFARHHIKGARATYAYPVKSEEDTGKIEAVVESLKANDDPVVIVCPRGAGGATRTYDYLLSRGIAAERLLILEKGQVGWACAPLTEGK